MSRLRGSKQVWAHTHTYRESEREREKEIRSAVVYCEDGVTPPACGPTLNCVSVCVRVCVCVCVTGLQRIYKSDPMTDPAFFDGCPNEGVFRNLLLALSFFHCVASGRRCVHTQTHTHTCTTPRPCMTPRPCKPCPTQKATIAAGSRGNT